MKRKLLSLAALGIVAMGVASSQPLTWERFNIPNFSESTTDRAKNTPEYLLWNLLGLGQITLALATKNSYKFFPQTDLLSYLQESLSSLVEDLEIEIDFGDTDIDDID